MKLLSSIILLCGSANAYDFYVKDKNGFSGKILGTFEII